MNEQDLLSMLWGNQGNGSNTPSVFGTTTPAQPNSNLLFGSGINVDLSTGIPLSGDSLTQIPTNGTVTQESFWGNPSLWNNVSKGVGAGAALANTFLGFQQLNQAKDQLSFQKEAFWMNYNQQVADREEAAKRRSIANGNI